MAHDSFFDVGGHSLLAIQIHSTLQNQIAHAKEMSVTDLFRFPTIALLAEHLSNQASHASVAQKQTQSEPEAPLLESSQNRSQARRQALKQRATRKPRKRSRR